MDSVPRMMTGGQRSKFADIIATLTGPSFGNALAMLSGMSHLMLPGMDLLINILFTNAKNWTAPRDPLVLDLNGNGIQTTAIDPARPILFDMDGDGTKHATGWVAAVEAIVVRDINGNGLIDSGRELSGDATLLTRGARVGQKAADGFEALADLDVSANGISYIAIPFKRTVLRPNPAYLSSTPGGITS